MHRLVVTAIIGLLGLYFVFLVLLRVFENRFIYFPPRSPAGLPQPETLDTHAEEVWLATTDKIRLHAFYLPNPSSPRVLLWFHGNAEDISTGFSQAEYYSDLHASVLALDYRGYGKSQGSPDEAGLYRDADAGYDYLVEARHIEPEEILILGQSLGGAVAIDLASRRRCGGLIVVSSFTSAREMAWRTFRLPFLGYVIKSRFNSLAKIARVQAPVLVVHGTRDEVVPFSMGRRLFEAAHEPKRFYPIEGGHHNDLMEAGGEAYLKCLRQFLHGSRDLSAAER